MTLEDFRLLVARISLAAPMGEAKAPQPKPKRVARLHKPARTPIRTSVARPA